VRTTRSSVREGAVPDRSSGGATFVGTSARSRPVPCPFLTLRSPRLGIECAGCLTRPLRYNRQSSSAGAASLSIPVQHLYELTYCLWVLSYDCLANETIRGHFHRDGAVPALVEMVVAAPREKVVRLSVSALRNLATCREDGGGALSISKRASGSSGFLQDMVGCGLHRTVNLLMNDRERTDPEFLEGTLAGFLRRAFKSDSSFCNIQSPFRPRPRCAPSTAKRDLQRHDSVGRLRLGSKIDPPEVGHCPHGKVLHGECEAHGGKGRQF
jgi:hypothetical protein